jgi:hypothetical protein
MMKRSPPDPKVFLFVCFLVVAIGGCGLALICYGWISLQKARASLDWPVADGRIVMSRFVPDSDGGRKAKIEYVYTVDEREHSSHVVVFGGLGDGGARGIHVGRYPQGKSVSVSYDPDDVTTAVLEPGVEIHATFFLGGYPLLAATLLGLGLNTIHRLFFLKAMPNLIDKAVIFLFKGKAGLAKFEKRQRDRQDSP